MSLSDTPTFPVLLQCIPQTKWQRSLIPAASNDFHNDLDDPPGWRAIDGYRIIDRERRIFSAEFDGSSYSFSSDGSVTDDELRELMVRNLHALGRSKADYVERAKSLHGQDLFDYTFQTVEELPEMSAAMHVGGCLLIASLCILAAAIPAGIIWWFFR
ncbi:MAG: hypothetical protein H7144_08670 [Burkholderiales bacterium]|nr:hypothetical protein [Phycisphaerae bacterium]